MQLAARSIKELYAYALAEGEGVGTAYEYYVKRMVLRKWLKRRPQRILIAGLPQKYGSSLDFLLLGHELGATVTVVEMRLARLQKLQRALAAAQDAGLLLGLQLQTLLVADLGALAGVQGDFDLALASEVVQQLGDRDAYFAQLQLLAAQIAIFTPNRDNQAHVGVSGLGGITLKQLRSHLGRFSAGRSGYIDMPPFPPGITRSEEQRAQATTGKGEALAMRVLELYARGERLLPQAIRRSQSHIVYALALR